MTNTKTHLITHQTRSQTYHISDTDNTYDFSKTRVTANTRQARAMSALARCIHISIAIILKHF